MGASNAVAVYVYWSHLDHAPFRLLVYMALVTLDNAKDGKPARRYWGGREPLAEALGHKIPTCDDDDAQKQRVRAFRNLAKVMTVLSREGAVELVVKPAPGRQAEYALWLNGSTSGSTVKGNASTSGGTVRGPNGSTSGDTTLLPEVTNASTSGSSTVLPEVVPEEEAGTTGEREDQSGGFPTQVQTAREGEREQAIDAVEEEAIKPALAECECGAVLDPDGTCFVCRTGRAS